MCDSPSSAKDTIYCEGIYNKTIKARKMVRINIMMVNGHYTICIFAQNKLESLKQAEAELGQAQPKLWLGFRLTVLKISDRGK